MASTYSSLLRIELIGTGDQSGLWGVTTNTNLGTLIEQAIAATATVSVTAGDVTLTELNGSSDQSRCAALLVTGSAGVSRNVVAPALSKLYVVSNTADAAVVLKTAASTGLTVPSGVTIFAYYNGTDFIAVSQPYDADLKAIADLATTGLIARTGSGTAAARTITASTGITVTNGDGVAGNPTVAVSTVPVANGGTNITSYTTGDLLYASGSTTLSKLADVATGNALISGGVGTAPSWGKVGLTTHVSGTLPVANGGTGTTSSTGSGSVVLSSSPTLSSPTFTTPVLGTPSSGTLTNCTGLPVSTGISGLGTGVATFLGTPSSANLKAAVTDETGSGALVFATSPTLVTPVLGTPSSGTLSNCTGLPLTTGITGTLAIANGGTGATDAATARSNLSVPSTTGSGASGSWSITAATATNIAGGTTNQIPYQTSAGTTSFITAPTSGMYLYYNGTNYTWQGATGGTAQAVTFNNGGAGGASGISFNGSTAITVSYNTIGAPSLTGTGASGTWGISVSGSSASVTNAITFNGSGLGDSSGTTYNGSTTKTISYNTVGAPSTSGVNATGTWGISVSGNAGTVTNGVYTSSSYSDPAWLTSLSSTKLSGAVSVANGGTGGTTAALARSNLSVPSTTGDGASGTWGINISGSAAQVATTNFTIVQSGTDLLFKYDGVTVAKLSSTGQFTAVV